MIGIIFRREMKTFLSTPMLWMVFLAQPFVIAALMACVQYRMRHLYTVQPDLVRMMLSKNVTVLLVSFSMLSVIHIVPRNIAIEKTTGLIETLFTTPLRLRDLVWGKSLQIGVLGYGMGLVLTFASSAILLWLAGDMSPLRQIPWHYWLFAFVGTPVIVVGFLNLVLILSLALPDARVGMLLYTMTSTVLVFLSSLYRSPTAEAAMMVILVLCGVACHVMWGLYGNRITVERIITA